MLKILFENRKTAMSFAAFIIFVTLTTVGPRDGGGVLDTTVQQIGNKRANGSAQEPQQFAEDPVMVLDERDRDSELAAENEDVFGEYGSSDSASQAASAPAPAPPPPQIAQARPFQPGGPIGGPVRADGPGIVVPHSDDAREAAASRQIPVSVIRTGKSAPQ